MRTTFVTTRTIKVGFVDDHIIGWALGQTVHQMKGLETVLIAKSGEEALEKLKTLDDLPDILVMDIKMDGLGGVETTRRVTALYPSIKTIALTAIEDIFPMIQMIGAGACGYFWKGIDPNELELMLPEIYWKGRYEADIYHLHRDELRKYQTEDGKSIFTDNEIEYLGLVCQGYTYYQIGEIMYRSEHTVKYYRRSLFDKLGVKKFIHMILEALRIGLINLDSFKKTTRFGS